MLLLKSYIYPQFYSNLSEFSISKYLKDFNEKFLKYWHDYNSLKIDYFFSLDFRIQSLKIILIFQF